MARSILDMGMGQLRFEESLRRADSMTQED